MKKSKEAKINGVCVRCWNKSATKLCKRGFPQDENRDNCRWASGVSK